MSSSSLSRSRRIDAICERFEADWQAGQRPTIEALVAAAEPVDRSRLLAELIALEHELRTSAGQPVRMQDYLARFPDDEPDVRAAFSALDEAAATGSDTPAAQPCELLSAGDDRYQLGQQIGQGGMGVVVSAHDPRLDRELAVKLLAKPLQTRREARERFLREARICARLQHPGIIPVHEMGWLDGRPYFAMKLVRGQSLAKLLNERAHPDQDLPRMLEVFERVCETVAYAHAQGVVHRDLKPANVMLGTFGEVYVIDWGLAKQTRVQGGREAADSKLLCHHDANATNDDSAATESNVVGPTTADASVAWTFLGDVVGTPRYMSPEQASGDVEAIDQRSDVFALGALLCEILTGKPPYSSGDRETRLERAQRGDLAETLARLDGSRADGDLIQLARDCLAVRPADRPTDAEQVLHRLTAFLRSVQDKLRRIELERAEAQARSEERRRRRRVVLTLTAGLALLAVTLAAGTTWFARREAARQRDESLRRAHVQRQLAETLNEVAQLYAQAPEDWRADPLRRGRIRELAQRADTLAESQFAGMAQVRQVAELVGRIASEDADGRLLDRLEDIREMQAEVNPRTNQFASGRTRPMYYRAFADYGIDAQAIDAPRAIARIRSRPPHVVEACVFGLESWRSLFKQNAPPSPWIDAVLDGIDDNPWRCAVREACRNREWPAVGQLLESVERESLSADAVHVVAAKLMDAHQFELALELLLAAQPDHPGDFWINQYLGLAFYCRPKRDLNESVRYFTAALAIRETDAAYLNLGAALWDLHRYPEAERAFHSALRLQPDYAHAYYYLASVLKAQNRIDEALAAVERALAANPDLAEAAALRDELRSER